MYFHTVTINKEKQNEEEIEVLSEDEEMAELNKKKDNRIKTLDFEIYLQQSLTKAGHKKSGGGTNRSGRSVYSSQPKEEAGPSEAIKEKDLSIAISMDLKLYSIRFFEYVN